MPSKNQLLAQQLRKDLIDMYRRYFFISLSLAFATLVYILFSAKDTLEFIASLPLFIFSFVMYYFLKYQTKDYKEKELEYMQEDTAKQESSL